MVAPTLKRAQDTAPGDDQKYGAPDIVEMVRVIEGDHPDGEKIQVGSVENAVSLTGAQTITTKTITGSTIAFGSNTLTDVASTNTAQTISAVKTFSSAPVIGTITNTGTLTLPTSTDTLVGRATTDILTTKTMFASNNTFEGLMHTPDQKKLGGWMGASSLTTGFGTAQGLIATAVGTGTSPVPTVATGKIANYATGAVAGNQAGLRIDGTGHGVHASVLRGLKGRFKCRFRLNTIADVRLYIGLHSRTSAYETGDDPLNAASGIMLALRSTDTPSGSPGNFQIASNDGSGATVFASTGVTVDSSFHTIDIRADAADTGWQWSMDGGAFSSVITTDVPTSATQLFACVQIETSAAAAKNFDWSYWFFETSA